MMYASNEFRKTRSKCCIPVGEVCNSLKPSEATQQMTNCHCNVYVNKVIHDMPVYIQL